MAIKYSLLPRVNRSTGETRVYGLVVPESKTSVDIITSELTARTTLTRPDVLATLSGIAEKAVSELAEGRTVRLGDLGSLFVTIRTEGSDDVEGFTASLIKGVNIRFRPSAYLRKQLTATATFERGVSKKAQAAAAKQAAENLQQHVDDANGEAEGNGD